MCLWPHVPAPFDLHAGACGCKITLGAKKGRRRSVLESGVTAPGPPNSMKLPHVAAAREKG